MRVSCDRSRLAEAFALVSSLAPKAGPKEALQCVKLDATADGCWLSATNLETSIRQQLVGAELLSSGTAAAGSALLNVARVGQIIRECNDDHLVIAVDGNHLLITSRNSEFRLNSINPNEYPSVKGWDEVNYLELPARWLREAIRRTSFATDPASSRFALGGVRVELDASDETAIKFIGTDGRRLALVCGQTAVVGEVDRMGGAIIPTQALNLVSKSLGGFEGLAKLTVRGNDVMFSIGTAAITARQVDGRFPNWRQVVPNRTSSAKIPLVVGPAHNAIRQAAIVADSDSHGLDFLFANGQLILTAATQNLGASQVELPIKHDGEPIRMKMDYRFFCDFFKALDPAQAFTLDVQSATSSALMSTDDGYSYVVMPMALDR